MHKTLDCFNQYLSKVMLCVGKSLEILEAEPGSWHLEQAMSDPSISQGKRYIVEESRERYI